MASEKQKNESICFKSSSYDENDKCKCIVCCLSYNYNYDSLISPKNNNIESSSPDFNDAVITSVYFLTPGGVDVKKYQQRQINSKNEELATKIIIWDKKESMLNRNESHLVPMNNTDKYWHNNSDVHKYILKQTK